MILGHMQGYPLDIFDVLITGSFAPDGSGPFCIYLYAADIVAPQVEVHGTDPQTGQPTATLTEVTPASLAAWQALGYCP